MTKNSYWQERFDQIEQAANNKSVRYTSKLEKKYKVAASEIDAQINKWYNRIAKNNEVSMTEARRLLSASELKEFKWTVEEYIKYGRENAVDQLWLKELENASAKFHINRLEAMKLECRQQIEKAMANGQENMYDMLRDVYKDTFYHSCYEIQKGIGVGFDVSKLNDNTVQTLINKPWAADGTNFSQKLWGNKTKLINTLDQELSRMVLTGESPRRAIQNIKEAMNSSLFSAKRLVLTEQAFFTSEAQKKSFNELDVERFEVLSSMDRTVCPICAANDKKNHPMIEFYVGITAPPFHPLCRCVTAPFFDDEFTSGERIVRGDDGETYRIPQNMSYNEWKESFVDGGNKDKLTPVIDVDKIQMDIDSLKSERIQISESITAKHEQLEKTTAQWLNDIDNDELAAEMELLQGELDLLTDKKISISNQIQELLAKLPKDNKARMDLSLVVDGKDLVGEVDYSAGTFVYDIEAAMNTQGFDGMPNVVEYDEFKAVMEKTNFYAERTYSADTQEQLDDFREQLYNGKWYVDCSDGGSQYGQGMYCSATYDLSDTKSIGGIGSEMSHYQVLNIEKGRKYSYTEGITLQPDAKILELPNGAKAEEYISDQYRYAYLRKYAKTSERKAVENYIEACQDLAEHPDIEELYNVRDELAKDIDSKLLRDAMDSLMYKVDGMKYPKMKNAGTLAVEMGYDAINAMGHGESGSYTVILNRTKVIFCKGGSIYGN